MLDHFCFSFTLYLLVLPNITNGSSGQGSHNQVGKRKMTASHGRDRPTGQQSWKKSGRVGSGQVKEHFWSQGPGNFEIKIFQKKIGDRSGRLGQILRAVRCNKGELVIPDYSSILPGYAWFSPISFLCLPIFEYKFSPTSKDFDHFEVLRLSLMPNYKILWD